MDHDRLKELLPLEALGTLDGEDARAMAEHLAAGCDECQAELRSFREAITALAINVAGDGPADRIWQWVARRFAADTTPTVSVASPASDRQATRTTDHSQRDGVSRLWRLTAVTATAAALTLALISGDYAKQIVALRKRIPRASPSSTIRRAHSRANWRIAIAISQRCRIRFRRADSSRRRSSLPTLV